MNETEASSSMRLVCISLEQAALHSLLAPFGSERRFLVFFPATFHRSRTLQILDLTRFSSICCWDLMGGREGGREGGGEAVATAAYLSKRVDLQM